MILHIKDGKVIMMVIKLKHIKQYQLHYIKRPIAFSEKLKRKKSKSGNFYIYFTKFHTDVKV